MILPFLGSSYRSQSLNVAAQRCVNFYAEIVEVKEGKSQLVLYPTPGFALEVTLSDGPVRALYTLNSRTFAVGGGTFYELTLVSGAIVATAYGLVTQDAYPATISSNGPIFNELLITSGDDAYLFNLATNVLTDITATIGPAKMGGFVDGYFIKLDTARAEIRVSDIDIGGTVWDTTNFGERNTAADTWKSMVISHREVWLFGSQKTDVWFNSGALFPFEPVPGAFMQQGIAAPWSAAVLGNKMIWLGANDQGEGVVWAAQGYQPVQISDKALAWAIQQYSTISDAVAFVYHDQGHGFYVLSFPTANATWVYDDTTGMWHERGWWNSTTMDYDDLHAATHTYAFGKHLVGDTTSGAIYDMDITHYTDAGGAVLRRLRQGPHLCGEQKWHFYHQVQLDLETGVGDTSTADPQIILQWSDDGGHTWSREHWRSAGAQGIFRARAVWRQLGRSRDRIFRVIMSDPVPWRLINFYAEIEKGTS
jgi:hypothetical protein